MPPVTRSQKRTPSRGRTPTRLTAQRIMPTPMSVSPPRGRSMNRATSRSRSRSLASWMAGNYGTNKGSSGSNVPNLTRSKAFLKTSRKGKRNYRDRASLIANGVVKVIETGVNAVDDEILYIGHSCPTFEMKYCAWWALFKRLMIKIGVNVGPFGGGSLLTSFALQVGDIFRLQYKVAANTTPTNLDFTILVGSTVDNLIIGYATNATIDVPTAQFYSMQYLPSGATSFAGNFIRLESSYLHFFVKNDLKLQNRSKNGAGLAQEDDVNNCPLYGKSYFGTGTGTRLKTLPVTSGLTANANTGLLVAGAASLNALGQVGYSEPLEYQYFANVSQVGKIHLDAGQMKTSVITKKFKMTFTNFMNAIAPQPSQLPITSTGTNTYRIKKIAQYRMFALEKMLDSVTTPSADTSVSVAAEHNTKVMCNFIEKRVNITAIQFVKNRI